MIRMLLYVLLAMTIASTADAATPTGSSRTSTTIRGAKMTIYTYRPTTRRCPSSSLTALWVFHGNSRAAEGYRDSARTIADARCMIVYAPLFTEQRFPSWSYHRGGVVDNDGDLRPASSWTVGYVADLIAWGRSRDGSKPYALYGFSAGGQFLSRVAAYTRPGATRIILGSPSTHVLATETDRVPYGFGDLPAGGMTVREYLAAPVTIYIGSEDDDPEDEDLTRSPEADAQGVHRLDRGVRTFEQAKAVAAANGWPFNWRLVIANGVGHSNGGMMRAPEMGSVF